MNLKTYYTSLNDSQKIEFAQKAGTTIRYLESHLIHRSRVPRPDLIKKLSDASNGKLPQKELILWFHEAKPA